jgi:hypothetical protein
MESPFRHIFITLVLSLRDKHHKERYPQRVLSPKALFVEFGGKGRGGL